MHKIQVRSEIVSCAFYLTKRYSCHQYAECQNVDDGYICTCREGFEGDGKNSCVDKNECSANKNPCGNKVCVNKVGSYECTCESGFEILRNKCRDINEVRTAIVNKALRQILVHKWKSRLRGERLLQ